MDFEPPPTELERRQRLYAARQALGDEAQRVPNQLLNERALIAGQRANDGDAGWLFSARGYMLQILIVCVYLSQDVGKNLFVQMAKAPPGEGGYTKQSMVVVVNI